jgi:hypothetical protein
MIALNEQISTEMQMIERETADLGNIIFTKTSTRKKRKTNESQEY